MAISDYTLSRLALAARARALAGDTEQARAAREAQQQRANLASVQQLLGVVPGIVGAVGDLGAAAGESAVQESLADITAGELARPPAPPAPPAPPVPKPDEMTEQMRGVPDVIRQLTEQAADESLARRRAADIAQFKAEQKEVLDTIAPGPASPVVNDVTMVPVGVGGRIPVPTVTPRMTPEKPAEESWDFTLEDLGEAGKPEAPAAADITMKMGEPTVTSAEAPAPPAPAQQPIEQPAPPVPPPAAAGTVDPSAEEAAKAVASAGLDKPESDPFAVQQAEYLKRIRSYEPPQYKQDPEGLAEDIVTDTWRRKTPNPILNILSFGQYNNKLEESRRLAKKLVAGEIRKARATDAAADRQRFESMAKLEAQQLALTQKNESDKRRAEIAANKSFNAEKMADRLAAYQQTDSLIMDVQDAARAVVTSGQPLPGGAVKALQMAKAMAVAATPEQSRTAAAGLNAALVGLGANGAVSLGAKATDADGLQAAVDAIDQAEMTDLQKNFLKKNLIMIQGLGKQKEGGRMTDKDLQFYLKSLVISDAENPSGMLRSIHDLRAQNARSQRQYLGIFSRLHPRANLAAEMLAEPEFDTELASAADALGWLAIAPAAAAALRRVQGRGLASVGREGKETAVDLATAARQAITGGTTTDTDSVAKKYGL